MQMHQVTSNLRQRIWLKISSPVLLLAIVSILWLLSYGIFHYLLGWNMIGSAYLSLFISVIGSELSLASAKRYIQKQRTMVLSNTPHPIESPYYIQTTHDPDAFNEIAGMESTIEVLKDALELPLRHPELIQGFGIKAGNGLLLHGVPGNAKTALVRAAASYFDMTFFLVNGSALTSGTVGSTEQAIRDVFAVAKANAPSIIFLDELDAVAMRRDGKHLNRPSDLALNSLLTELDGFVSRQGVYVIGATNRLDVLDDALLRPGRFDVQIEVLSPDRESRIELFQFFARKMPVAQGIEWEKLADYTEGSTGAYIEGCVQKAARIAMKRTMATGIMGLIVFDDFVNGLNN